MADFTKLLSTQVDQTEKPKPTPVGTYVAVVQGHEFGESGQKKTPFVKFNLQLMAPQDDVDASDLETAGGFEKIKERKPTITFYLTEDAMWRLREFLENTLRLNISGRSYSEVIANDTTGQQLNVHFAHEISTKNAGGVYANIDSHSAV